MLQFHLIEDLETKQTQDRASWTCMYQQRSLNTLWISKRQKSLSIKPLPSLCNLKDLKPVLASIQLKKFVKMHNKLQQVCNFKWQKVQIFWLFQNEPHPPFNKPCCNSFEVFMGSSPYFLYRLTKIKNFWSFHLILIHAWFVIKSICCIRIQIF